MLGLAGLLLSSASAMAQGTKNSAAVTPTTLPGEENLSVQERAERDFLMPVRRKQAPVLKQVAQDEAVATQTAADMLARTPEVAEEAKASEEEAAKAAPRRTYHRSSSHRSSARRKTVHHSSSSKSRHTSSRRR